MNHVAAIYKKQIKDTIKNKTVLIQFLMFPILTVVMSRGVRIDGMPEHFFVSLFAVMYVGMAPLTSMAAVISEEKEANTLRVLLMSNVKPHEYLLGVGSYIWLSCMIGAGVICLTGGYGLKESLLFMAVMAVGIAASMLVGAAVGVFSKNQMMATSITVPVMMIFSFLPMMSLFNEKVSKVAGFLWSEQVSRMLDRIETGRFGAASIGIVLANVLVFVILFIAAYRKRGLE